MRAYKGFDFAADGTISCRDHQYTVGETYVHDGPVELCAAGYHACPMPLDTLRYYPSSSSVYHEVEVDDDAQGDGDKIVSDRITVGARLSLADMIATHLDIVHDRVRRGAATSGNWATAAASGVRSTAATSGNWSTAATSGNWSTAAASGTGATAATSGQESTAATSGTGATAATSGYGATAATSGYRSTAATSGTGATAATSGYRSTAAASGTGATAAASGNWATAATSGNRSTAATSGYRSTAATSGNWSTAATSGNWSTAAASGNWATAAASGHESIAVAGGYECRARGALGGWIVLTERDHTGHILGVQAVPVDGETIRADTLYVLRGGQIVAVES